MHARKIVDEFLGACLSCLHAKQAEAIKVAVSGALEGGRLSLSQLARSAASTTPMRHRIKRIDRLLGNKALHAARAAIYHGVAERWLAGIEQVLVVIDWGDVLRFTRKRRLGCGNLPTASTCVATPRPAGWY